MSEASAVLGRFSDALKGAARVRLSARMRVGLALAFAVLIAVKMPSILLQGRFWAEEGSRFFENAWQLPWWKAMLAPWGGYLNITANVAGLLAWYVPPLKWAPYASTLLALVFQVCPAVVLLTSRITWLDRPLPMILALLLIATPPAAEEIWLSSIGSQWQLTLCAALILACPARGGGVGVFRLVLLALAVLSGPGAWILTALFAIRAAVERSWDRALQTGVLAAGVLVQLVFFYSHTDPRSYTIHPIFYLDVAFLKHVLMPFLGPEREYPIAETIHRAAVLGHMPRWPAVIMGAILLAAGRVLLPDWRREPLWLALAAAIIACVTYFGVLGDPIAMLEGVNGERYAFAPQVLIALALLGCAATRRGLVGRITGGCVVWLLVVGAINYFRPALPDYAGGPGWRSELALHRRDPNHVIAISPPGWTVRLPPGL